MKGDHSKKIIVNINCIYGENIIINCEILIKMIKYAMSFLERHLPLLFSYRVLPL